MREIYKSSPNMVVEPVRKFFEAKYPWRTLPIGSSFSVPFADIKYKTLYNYAGRMSKKLNKVFRVVDHGEAIGYEVGRLK